MPSDWGFINEALTGVRPYIQQYIDASMEVGKPSIEADRGRRIQFVVELALQDKGTEKIQHFFDTHHVNVLSDLETVLLSDLKLLEIGAIKSFIIALGELGLPLYNSLFKGLAKIIVHEKEFLGMPIQTLIQEYNLAQFKTEEGFSLVHYAFQEGDVELIQKLHELNFSFAQLDNEGNNAFHYMASSSTFEENFDFERHQDGLGKILHSLGRSLDTRNDDGYTPLHFAYMYRNFPAVRLLTECSYAELDPEQQTILHLCLTPEAHEDQSAVPFMKHCLRVSEIYGARININAQNVFGETALHIAAALERSTAEINYLLSVPGIDKTILNVQNLTALDIFAEREDQSSELPSGLFDDPAAMSRPSSRGRAATPLNTAVTKGFWSMVAEAIRQGGVNPKTYQLDGKTLLDYALQDKVPELLKALFDQGLDPYEMRDGVPLIMSIAKGGHRELFEQCLTQDIDLYTVDSNNNTVLTYAAESGNPEVLKLLVSTNFSLEHDDYLEAQSLLIKAVEDGAYSIAEVFIDQNMVSPLIGIGGQSILQYLFDKAQWLLVHKILHNYEVINQGSVNPVLLIGSAYHFVSEVVKAYSEAKQLNKPIPPGLEPLKERVQEYISAAFAWIEKNYKESEEAAQERDGLVAQILLSEDVELIARLPHLHIPKPDFRIRGKSLVQHALDAKSQLLINKLTQIYPTLINLTQYYQDKPLIEWIIEKKLWQALGYLFKLGSVKVKHVHPYHDQLIEKSFASLSEQGIAIAEMLLAEKVPYSHIKINDLPVLHFVAKYLDFDQFEKVGAHLTDFDLVDSRGHTALYYAFQNVNSDEEAEDDDDSDALQIANYLLNSGCPLKIYDWDFNLTQAYCKKCMTVVSKYWERRNRIDNRSNQDYLQQIPFDTHLLRYLYNIAAYTYSPFAQDDQVQDLIQSSYTFFKNSKDMTKAQELVIEDIHYEGNCYITLKEAFDKIPQEELEGIVDIEEKKMTIQEQRNNFNQFINIVETRKRIKGIAEGAEAATYEPIERTLKRLAIALPLLKPEDQITYFSHFSRITYGHCIDPYIKANQSLYVSLQTISFDAKQPVYPSEINVKGVDTQSDFEQEIIFKILECRDMAFDNILQDSIDSIDTHARNWALKYFGPLIGKSFDQDDMYLEGHGKQLLEHFLQTEYDLDRVVLIGHLDQMFQEYFLGFTFQVMSRYLDQKFSEKTYKDLSCSELIANYFHNLLLKRLKLKNDMVSSMGNAQDVKTYLKLMQSRMEIEINLNNKQLAIHRNRSRVKQIMEKMESKQTDPKISESLAGEIPKLDQEHLAKTKEAQVIRNDLDQLQKKIDTLASKMPELALQLESHQKQYDTQTELLMETYIYIDEETRASKITLQGSWELLRLILEVEKRNA